MKLETFFQRLRKLHDDEFLSYSDAKKKRVLSRLINAVNSSPSEIYFCVREKAIELQKAIRFGCLRCSNSSCFFSKVEFLIKSIGLYPEDVSLMEQNGISLEGVEDPAPIRKYEDARNIFPDLSLEEFQGENRAFTKELGYSASLRLIEREGKIQCFYFDNETNSCSIQGFKPLVCLTFPFRVENDGTQAGMMLALDCNWLAPLLDFGKSEVGSSVFEQEMMKTLSYWEYICSIMIFLKQKERIEYKNGDLKPIVIV